jgi:hypothetical protein
MPTFKKVEVVDARQFTGGVDQGMELVLWVESGGGVGWWAEADPELKWHEQLRIGKQGALRSAYVGDWIVHHQAGGFSVMRPQELHEQYTQV